MFPNQNDTNIQSMVIRTMENRLAWTFSKSTGGFLVPDSCDRLFHKIGEREIPHYNDWKVSAKVR